MDDLNNLLAVALLLLPVVIGVLAAASHLADSDVGIAAR